MVMTWLHHYTPQRILMSEVYGQCPVVVYTYGEEQLVIFKYILPVGKFSNGFQVVIAYCLVKETWEVEARESHLKIPFVSALLRVMRAKYALTI